jgi:hypothetical protein
MSVHAQRIIRAYHGELPKDILQLLNTIAVLQEDKASWFFDGSLDTLATYLGDLGGMFFVTKTGDVYITHHNSWGAR